MDGNSPKLPETVETSVSALRVLRDWLDREGGNQRMPRVLGLLAERATVNLLAGHPAEGCDADTLRTLYYDTHGGIVPSMPPARWLPRAALTNWWDQRAKVIEQACRDAGLASMPTLHVNEGGGRGNQTEYRLGFELISTLDEPGSTFIEPPQEPGSPGTADIHYLMEPAKPAWWLRPIIGTVPFRMRGWRGYLLLSIVIAEGIFVILLWLAILLSINVNRPISGSDLVSIILGAAITVWLWRGLKPFVRLPTERVTVASDLFLAWNQAFGQIRLSRDAKSKIAGGWFQLVRHWGYCPICSGEVEIQPGGEQFPGRVVGRCSDSPLEHVFSFDPTRLVGTHLLPDNP